MDAQRNFFIIVFLFISFVIWRIWEVEYISKISIRNIKESKNFVKKSINNNDNLSITKSGQLITIQTDVLLLKINTYGGDIEEAFLLKYFDRLGSLQPFCLLKKSATCIYKTESGLISKNSLNDKKLLYVTNNNMYILGDKQNELTISLIHTTPDNVEYEKVFNLKRNSFAVSISYHINNKSTQSLELSLFGQLKQTNNCLTSQYTKLDNFSLRNYYSGAYSSFNNKYQKYNFQDIKKKELNINTIGGWIAILQQYFAAAWIPLTLGDNFYYSIYSNDQLLVGFKSTPVNIIPNNQSTLKTILWLGPKIQDEMRIVSPYLNLTVDYGWLWFIAQPLFKFLKFIHSYVHNWGFSIIIITFVIRGIMHPLSKAQYISAAKLRVLQPKLIEIRERFSYDKKRQSQEMMLLYKTEKVNPFGGCLPFIIQMPIFLALYYMLSGSIELRHAPLILWIRDLSSRDPYYILPVLMGITMFIIQKTSSNNISDPIQKKIMFFMPIIFVVFSLWFPSGLVLYYVVSNLMTIIQQQFIYRKLEKRNFK